MDDVAGVPWEHEDPATRQPYRSPLGVHPIDIITKNTFLSGQIGQSRNGGKRESSSLLHRIGDDGIITFADFSTILGMRSDDCNAIFSQMRRIYDGRLNKEVGTNEADPEWEGHITFLAACTNSIERFQQQMKGLGERFTQVVLPRGSRRAAVAAISQNKQTCTSELREVVQSLLNRLPASAPAIPESYYYRIASLAEFTAFARTPIHRDAHKNIIAIPEIETPTRLSEVLVNLGKGSAALDGRDTINESDFDMMVRVAFDCIPEARRAYLRYLVGGKREFLTVRNTLLHHTIEELSELDVADGGMLTEQFQCLLDEAIVTGANCRRPSDNKGILCWKPQ